MLNLLISDIDQFLNGFQLEVSQFCTNLGLNCLFVIILVPTFSVGKIIYSGVGKFGQWAGLIYWVDKVINILLFTSLKYPTVSLWEIFMPIFCICKFISVTNICLCAITKAFFSPVFISVNSKLSKHKDGFIK